MPCDAGARLGFFLCGADEQTAREILRSLKVSGALTVAALCVVRGAGRIIAEPSDARRLIGECGAHAKNAAAASSILGNSPADAPLWVEKNQAPCKVSELEITGRDILSLGAIGKDVGRVLEFLLECVIENPSLNEHDVLTDLAKKFIEQEMAK